MPFLPKAPRIAGIEITPTSYKIALLKKKGRSWQVERVEEVPSNVKPLDILPKEALIVTALPSREVLVRPLDLPLKKEKDIEEAIAFQAEPLLPYPVENGVIQKIVAKRHGEGSLVTLLAAKKEHCERHLAGLKARGFEPDYVTAVGAALAALATTSEAELWIELGKTEGTVALIEDRKLLIAKAVDNSPLEIQKTVMSILAAYKQKKIESITLLSDDPEMYKKVEEATKKHVIPPSIDLYQKFGVACGLALAASEKGFPDFRAKEINFSLRFKRVKKPLFAYLFLASLLFVTMSALEKREIHQRERALLNKSSTLFPEGCQNLTELAEKLEKKKVALDKIPDTFPLYPGLPKVRDLLAWFSQGEKFAGTAIEEMHYVMVTRPSFEKKNERYQVKVEMVLTCPTTAEANRLHEALLTSPFLDTTKPVEWVPTKGKYKTTFFLKDKTRYS